MYNFSPDTLPLTPPVHLQVFLRPWFDKKCMHEGLELIRAKKISHFFFYRHAAAGLFDNDQPLYILFSRTAKIRQGFTLQEHSCEYCGPRAAGDKNRCPHLAALAILSLIARENDERNLFPIPLHFEKTGWSKIEEFLYNWLSNQKGKTTCNIEQNSLQLAKESNREGIRVTLPDTEKAQWEIFFTDKEKNREDVLYKLREQVKSLTLTENEAKLLYNGCETRGCKRDSSMWSWICHYFVQLAVDTLPQLSFDNDSKKILLTLEQDGAKFVITLPNNKTWELLSLLKNYGLEIPILPPAEECFQVSFASGAIRVVPSFRMADSTCISAEDLNGHKMGSHYYLPETGFLPVKKIPGDGIIKHPDNGGQASLLDFMARSQEPTGEYTVEANRVPDFLAKNSTALRFAGNKVEPAILDMKTVDFPQKLVIEKFYEDIEWCYLSFHYGMGDKTISLSDILQACEAKAEFIPGEEWLRLSDSPLSWLYDLLPERLTRSKDGAENVLQLRHSELMALTSLVPEVSNKVKKKTFQKKLAALLDCNSWSDDSLLEDCPDHLRSYQRNGLAWLNNIYQFCLGGLLADDMGLGKTHQGLALLQTISRRAKKGSAQLIICPASVLYHWKNKLDAFYPEMQYTIHYGPERVLDTTVNPGLLITTYAIARIDQELLAEIPFDIILLDEIQNLKNNKTAMHKAVNDLNARVKIGLTGTPIENSLTDLHSLFSICLPGFFGSIKNFNNTYLIPIKEHKNKKVEKRLRNLIQPFILRRNRKQVLKELPELTIDDRICELSTTQVKLYRDTVDESQELIEDLTLEEESIRYIHILAMLTRLKQICNHPCLLEGCRDATQYESGKWNLFVELLSECLAANLKVVVFSQYTGMLDIIEHYLDHAAIGYARLRGNMPVASREKMLQKFSDDSECKIFCASLLAGGTGIDLVAAQVVIHYDRWWNPAKEAQATARVHRMGQKKQVQVFRLITTGTLEEKIHALLKQKQEMADSLISEDEGGVIKQLDRSHLKELFRLG